MTDRNHSPCDAEPTLESDDDATYDRMHARRGSPEALMKAQYDGLIAAPVLRVRALAFAIIVAKRLMARDEGVGTTPTYFSELVRTEFGAARGRASLPALTIDEKAILDSASSTAHTHAVRYARKRGIVVARIRRVGHRWLKPAVVIEPTSPEMGVVA